MKAFQYVSAKSIDEAQHAIGTKGRYLAGGIDLLGEMKEYIVSPDVLVNVKNISSFTEPVAETKSADHKLSGLTTMAEIAKDPEVKSTFPGLAFAASQVGSPQIRNVATLAGNLLQHSRCWFYRQRDLTCYRKGGSACPAQEGDNRYLALFTGCDCISTVVSNMATILTALDAKVSVLSPGQKPRLLTMDELYAKAWSDPTVHHSLNAADLLTSVSISKERTRSIYMQQSEKREFDWALVSCAVAGNVKGGNFSKTRVVLGAIAPVPYYVPEVTDFLEGKPANAETVSKAADMILSKAKPLAENGYKVPLAHTLIRRSLLALAENPA